MGLLLFIHSRQINANRLTFGCTYNLLSVIISLIEIKAAAHPSIIDYPTKVNSDSPPPPEQIFK